MFSFLRRRGNDAERMTVQHLKKQGYRVLDTNVRLGHGELDIVAMDGNVLVGIEVKARKDDAYGSAYEAISATKAQRIASALTTYIHSRKLHHLSARVDLAAVSLGIDGAPLGVELITDIVDIESSLRGKRWQR